MTIHISIQRLFLIAVFRNLLKLFQIAVNPVFNKVIPKALQQKAITKPILNSINKPKIRKIRFINQASNVIRDKNLP